VESGSGCCVSKPERSTPQQERSRAAVTRVLDAADELFAEHGVHGTQIAMIIERSRVSAGSLYRFFPDKMSIAEALLERHARQMSGLQVQLSPAKSVDELLELVNLLVEIAASHQRNNPGYRALTKVFSASDPQSPLHAIRVAQVDAMVHLACKVVEPADMPDLRKAVEYMAVIMSALNNTNEIVATPQGRIDEIKRILRAYLRDVLSSPATAAAPERVAERV